MPVVCVSTTPSALIVTDGEPHYQPVNGTSLQRLTNTASTVFREPTDRELYVQLPVGWFRAWTPNGPCSYLRQRAARGFAIRTPSSDASGRAHTRGCLSSRCRLGRPVSRRRHQTEWHPCSRFSFRATERNRRARFRAATRRRSRMLTNPRPAFRLEAVGIEAPAGILNG